MYFPGIPFSDTVRGNALPDIKVLLTVQSQRQVQLPPISLEDLIILGCKNHLLIRYYLKNNLILITVCLGKGWLQSALLVN